MIQKVKPDMTISWEQHLKKGNVWRVEVELSIKSTSSPKTPSIVTMYTVGFDGSKATVDIL